MRPGWPLLLLWGVVGVLFVPPARPTPQPAHDEASPAALTQAVDSASVFPDGDVLPGDVPREMSEPGLMPQLDLNSDPTRAGPRCGVAFALHQRPPPVVIPI